MSPAASHLSLVVSAMNARAEASRARTDAPTEAKPRQRPLGQVLIDRRAVDPGDLLKAVALRQRQDVRIGDILVAHGWVNEADLMAGIADQWGSAPVDLDATPPDPRLADCLPAELCLAESCIPWQRIGDAIIIATARPDRFGVIAAHLPADAGPFLPALAPERQIAAAVTRQHRTGMARRAETRLAAADSCRSHDPGAAIRLAMLAVACLIAVLTLAPGGTLIALICWTILTLMLTTGLKLAAFVAVLRSPPAPPPSRQPHPGPAPQLPVISVLVPLFGESDIAPRLIARLGRMDYPKELTDIILIAEAGDTLTLDALAAARLPRWMRVVTVPDGPIRTKPRALNYALAFARGSIIGVWDAEDAPATDQLHQVVRHFAAAPPEVVCLQGILDFYNARRNWLSRCFAIEYAAWFRVVLPGLERLGLAVPLGGTTLFFRRAALEAIGGWDAHNVTEDADLGIRLARRGFRTELIRTVTEEEPNARALPWIRQRSRWLKGYAMTWAVHMRDPARLLRDLGPTRFLGVQVLFLGTLSQFLLAPVLWTYWGLALVGGAVAPAPVPFVGIVALSALFVLSEALNIAVGIYATHKAGHRHLMKWVPTLMVYFPLGTLAAVKALYEVVLRPFYWDKTDHGIFDADAGQDALSEADHSPNTSAGAERPVGRPAAVAAVVAVAADTAKAAAQPDAPVPGPGPAPSQQLLGPELARARARARVLSRSGTPLILMRPARMPGPDRAERRIPARGAPPLVLVARMPKGADDAAVGPVDLIGKASAQVSDPGSAPRD